MPTTQLVLLRRRGVVNARIIARLSLLFACMFGQVAAAEPEDDDADQAHLPPGTEWWCFYVYLEPTYQGQCFRSQPVCNAAAKAFGESWNGAKCSRQPRAVAVTYENVVQGRITHTTYYNLKNCVAGRDDLSGPDYAHLSRCTIVGSTTGHAFAQAAILDGRGWFCVCFVVWW